MAVDMYLDITDVTGESKGKDHEDQMDVLAWSWGMSQSGTMHMGGGGGSGKVSVQDLSITKYVDAASEALMKFCCTGEHKDEAVLTVKKAGGEQHDYIVITMTKVLISSISTGGSGGEDRLTENVTLNFEEVKFQYNKQTEDGSMEEGDGYAWNIGQNAEA